MTIPRATIAFAVMSVAIACDRAENASTRDTSVAAPAQGSTSGARPTTDALTDTGFGAVRIGEPVAQLNARARILSPSLASLSKGCEYAKVEGVPDSLVVMVEDGVVARVDVHTHAISTREGARIGDSESRIHDLYGARVTVTPHKYTDGHYLTVKPADARDTTHLIVFETGHDTVVTFRAGKRPQVQYVEGCA
ncbi:MAG TPA: hypothetical protein VJ867_16265 [Gemmatimonadaceae bacterium]|nr:hypothetical protein [Gemmatimonadaceae bacterium]